MTINLNTGSVQTPKSHETYSSSGYSGCHKTEFDDTTPSELVIFPNAIRGALRVEPKTMVVVTGYNIIDQTQVVFRKILASNGVPAQGSNGCCPSITVGHSIRLHSVELPCWKLDRCNPIFVIKTPGIYEVDVLGSSADVVITATTFEMQEVNEFGKCDCPPSGTSVSGTPETPILTEPSTEPSTDTVISEPTEIPSDTVISEPVEIPFVDVTYE